MKVIGKLVAPAGLTYVTWKEGKHQIRAAIKAAGMTPIGTFRPRSVNRSQYSIKVSEDTYIIANRAPNADIQVTTVTVVDPSTVESTN